MHIALPAIYAKKFIAKNRLLGDFEWYIRRRSLNIDFNIHTIRPIDVIRECRGDVYARRIHEKAGKPLNEVFGDDGLQDVLIESTCEYYSRQRGYKWGDIEYISAPINRYSITMDDENRVYFETYAQAAMHYITLFWPDNVIGGN